MGRTLIAIAALMSQEVASAAAQVPTVPDPTVMIILGAATAECTEQGGAFISLPHVPAQLC